MASGSSSVTPSVGPTGTITHWRVRSDRRASMAPVRTNAWPHPIVPTGWAELRVRYESLAAAHPQLAFLLRIVESVESVEGSGVADELAATTSMHDLVVVERPVADPPLDVIIVRAPGSLRPPDDGNARIEHRTHSGRDDDIQRPAADAVGLFWRFTAEKWGIAPRS